MDISARMRQILLALLHENGPISVKLLAEQIGVSKRTVQRELEYMERTLKGYEVRFTSKTGVGVWLEGGEEEKKRLLAEISRGDSYDVSNREDRRKRLVLEILKEKGLKKLYYYSSQFGVSEATVSADLESVESWLGQFGLQISREAGLKPMEAKRTTAGQSVLLLKKISIQIYSGKPMRKIPRC